MLANMQKIVAKSAQRMVRPQFEQLCREIVQERNALLTLEEVAAKCVVGRPYAVVGAPHIESEDERQRMPGREPRHLYILKELTDPSTDTAFMVAVNYPLPREFLFDGRDIIGLTPAVRAYFLAQKRAAPPPLPARRSAAAKVLLLPPPAQPAPQPIRSGRAIAEPLAIAAS